MRGEVGGEQRVTRTSARLINSPTPSYVETDSDDDTDSNLGDQWRRRKRSGRSGGPKIDTKKYRCPTPHPNRTRLSSTSSSTTRRSPSAVHARVPSTQLPRSSCDNVGSNPPILAPEPMRTKTSNVRETRLRKRQGELQDNTGQLTSVDIGVSNETDTPRNEGRRPRVDNPGPSREFGNETLHERSASYLPVGNLDSTTPSQDTLRPIRPNPRYATGSFNTQLEIPGPSPIPVHITQNNVECHQNNSGFGFEGEHVQSQTQPYSYSSNFPERQFPWMMNYNYCLMHAHALQGLIHRNYVHELQGNDLQNFSGNLPRNPLETIPEIPAVSSFGGQQENLQGSPNQPQIMPGSNETNIVYASGYPVVGHIHTIPEIVPRNQSDDLPVLSTHLRRIQSDNFLLTPPATAANIPLDQGLLPQNTSANSPQIPPTNLPQSTQKDLRQNPPTNLPQYSPANLTENSPTNLRQDPPVNLSQNPPTNLPQIPPANLPQNPPANLSDPLIDNTTTSGQISNVVRTTSPRPDGEVLDTYWPMFQCIRQLSSHMQKQPTVYEEGIYHLKKVLDVVGSHHNQLWLPEPSSAPAIASTSGSAGATVGTAWVERCMDGRSQCRY